MDTPSNLSLVNNLTAGQPNPNVAWSNSWMQVDNNAGRPLFANASYITNLSDLEISLHSDGGLSIGNVSIIDKSGSGLVPDVVPTGTGSAALRVLTQSFDAVHDTVSLGDINGNNVSVTNSALNVFVNNLQSTTVTNWDVLSAAINNSTYTTLPSNPANEITILNNTGGTMYIKNASKSIGLPIDNNTSVDLKLVGDTSEVAIKASSANKTVFATFISYN